MNRPDPLDAIPGGARGNTSELPPTPENVEFDFPLVTVRFHADPHCHHIENNVTRVRTPNQLPIEHIPLDTYEKGTPSEINFRDDRVQDDAFE